LGINEKGQGTSMQAPEADLRCLNKLGHLGCAAGYCHWLTHELAISLCGEAARVVMDRGSEGQ